MIPVERITEMLLADRHWYGVYNVQIMPVSYGSIDDKHVLHTAFSRPDELMFQYEDGIGEVCYCLVNSVRAFRCTAPSGG